MLKGLKLWVRHQVMQKYEIHLTGYQIMTQYCILRLLEITI